MNNDNSMIQNKPEVIAARAAYMKTALKIPPQDIEKICLEYYTNYGTTMAGLVVRPAFLSSCHADLLACIAFLDGMRYAKHVKGGRLLVASCFEQSFLSQLFPTHLLRGTSMLE